MNHLLFLVNVLLLTYASCEYETFDQFLLCESTDERIDQINEAHVDKEDEFYFADILGNKTVIYSLDHKFFSTKCTEVSTIKVPQKVQTCTRDLYIYYILST